MAMIRPISLVLLVLASVTIVISIRDKIIPRQFPGDHVSFAIVFGWFAVPSLGAKVDDSDYLVDEDDDLVLQSLRRIYELSDSTDRVDDFDFFAGKGQVHAIVCLSERLCNDRSSKLTEATLQKRTNLEYSLL